MDAITQKISSFLDNKQINDSLIREVVTNFISEHTRLFGDVVSFDELMDRLNSNLNSINMVDPSKNVSSNEIGCYEGFEKNSISMFFNPDYLKDPVLKNDFISALTHELTHCAYNIKTNDLFGTEKQVFGSYMKLINGKNSLTDGDSIYMEAIINYISCCVEGKRNNIYPAKTASIAKLAEMIDVKEMVRSSFHSDLESFKQAFAELSPSAYDYFTNGMKWLNTPGEYSYNKSQEIFNNFYEGKIPGISPEKREFLELSNLKKSYDEYTSFVMQSLNQSENLDIGNGRSRGIIDMKILSIILSIICVIGIFLVLIIW